MAETTYLEAVREALLEEMDRDPTVLLLGEDIGVYGGAFKATAGLLERFGWERVIDTPISESAMVGAAVGMSYLGLRPVVEMQFIDFIALRFRADHECGGEITLSRRRACAPGDSGSLGRRSSRRPFSFRESGDVLRAYSRVEGGLPRNAVRRKRLAQIGYPRQ